MLIARRGKDVAVLVSVEEAHLLEMFENHIDIAAACKALANPKNKARIPWEKVKKDLGLFEVLPTARDELTALPRDAQRKIAAKIDRLTDNPRPPGAELLKGTTEKLWRVRVGDYRIVYSIEDRRLLVLVIRVARREVGRKLARVAQDLVTDPLETDNFRRSRP